MFLCLGLTAVIISGSLNSALAASVSRPENLEAHPLSNFFVRLLCYMLVAVILSEFLIEKDLRKKLFAPLAIIVGNVFWCFLFFRLNEPGLSFGLLLCMDLDLFYMLRLSRRRLPLYLMTAVLVCRYIYLTGSNLCFLITN